MTHTIAILDNSEMIRMGIYKATSMAISVGRCHEVESVEQLCAVVDRHDVSIIFTNTLFYHDMKCELAKSNVSKPFCVGVVSNSFEEGMLAFYDELVYLNDPIEKIGKKVQQMVEKNQVAPQKQNVDLTEREREVLHLIAKGYAHKEISDALCISTHTVVTHRKNIAQKLGIKSSSGLTVYAILNKLIEPEEMQEMLQ